MGYGQDMSARAAFIPNNDLALFLDVDGTLLEIAATPDRVRVPASLRNTLRLAFEREHGADANHSRERRIDGPQAGHDFVAY